MEPAAPDILFCLDAPTHFPPARELRVAGWIAARATIGSVHAVAPDGRAGRDFVLDERPDVRAAKPGYPEVRGFSGTLPRDWLHGDTLVLESAIGAAVHRFPSALPPAVDLAAKQKKLDRIAPLLRTDVSAERDLHHFDCLSAELRARFAIVDTAAVSANAYDGVALDLIRRSGDGLVLDAGAGRRADYLPNVVNFEIVPYPSTDVLGVGEELPFVDHAFDAVLSLNVLEHVRDPFRCARELSRVLKPGGTLYAAVPFLQHYHGYPHHYYNMTAQGLANLFADTLKIQEQKVLASGHPIWTLSWFLQIYCAGLPPEERARFEQMRVADFLPGPESLLQADFVTRLSEAANFQIASTTMLVARKAGQLPP